MTPQLLEPRDDDEQPTDQTGDQPTDSIDSTDSTNSGAPDSRSADSETTDSGTADSASSDSPTENESNASSPTTLSVETDRGTATVSLPPTADGEEAAAIAAALSVHLDEEETDEEEPTVDRWKLSARLGRNGHGRRRARTPRTYTRGSEWKFANRAW